MRDLIGTAGAGPTCGEPHAWSNLRRLALPRATASVAAHAPTTPEPPYCSGTDDRPGTDERTCDTVAVKIRLMRVGKKKQPSYRIVVADSRKPRNGRFIEIIGHYAPRQEPSGLDVDDDKALDWLKKGAQPTEQVSKLLDVAGVWARYEAETGRPAKAKVAIGTTRRAAKSAPAEEPAGDPGGGSGSGTDAGEAESS